MEKTMSHKLTIKAFFFNAKTDYLPYYKNFSITMASDATAKELLAQIQEQNENFSYPKQLLIFRINNLVVDAKETIGAIVERLGTELQIDPVSTYRSNDGLKINDADFMQSFELLAPYASDEDLKEYKKMYALHYASESANFDRAYIGDAVLVLAHIMIEKNPDNTDAILRPDGSFVMLPAVYYYVGYSHYWTKSINKGQALLEDWRSYEGIQKRVF